MTSKSNDNNTWGNWHQYETEPVKRVGNRSEAESETVKSHEMFVAPRPVSETGIEVDRDKIDRLTVKTIEDTTRMVEMLRSDEHNMHYINQYHQMHDQSNVSGKAA